MFIVRLQTFDEQRVATAEKRCWRILWELAKIIRRSAQPPCGNASRTGSYFTAGTSGSPCGSSDELQQSTFLMGNLDGAGRMGKRAPTTNCLHCQLAGASFFSVLLLPFGRKVGGFCLSGGGCLGSCDAPGDPLWWSALRFTGRQRRNLQTPEERKPGNKSPSEMMICPISSVDTC